MLARLQKWVLSNWALKLFALGVAVLLWNAYNAEPVVEVGFQVPIEFHNLAPGLEIAGDPPAQGYVRVRGRSILLRRLAPTDLAIRVDLSSKAAGETPVPITTREVTKSFGATVVRISPSQIRLRLVTRKEPLPAAAR